MVSMLVAVQPRSGSILVPLESPEALDSFKFKAVERILLKC